MTINLEEMKEIAKRLPIGFYLGRKTPVIVEPGKCAYCDMVKGVIHLGVGVLQMAARQIDASDAAEWDREALLRCLLYHEIGHLLLTPSDLKQTTLYLLPDELRKHQSRIINIFEDERIESLLASAFIGVNFKKFVRLMHKQRVNGGDMLSKIFKAIRLRETTTEISDEIDDAIKELRKLNVNTTRLVSCWPYNFDNRLVKIINMILKQEKEQNEDSNNSDKSKQSSNNSEQNEPEDSQEEQDGGGQGSTNNSNEVKDKSDKDDSTESEGGDKDSREDEESDEDSNSAGNGGGNEDDSEDSPEDNSAANNGGNGEDGSEEDGASAPSPNESSPNESEENDDEGEDDPAESEEDESAFPSENESKPECDDHSSCGKKIELPEDYLRSLAASIFSTPPPNVAKTLNKFASRLAKKKGNQAAGIWSGLHGKIDNRRDAMGKDKICRRKSDVGDSLMDSVNMNLWVDVSGSFSRSKDELNNILAAVSRALQMAGSKLKVNVIHAGECALVVPSDSWAVDPHTDNAINETYLNAWKKTRDKTRRNIDIVVFDGVCGYGAHLMNNGHSRHPQIQIEIEIAKRIWNNRDCWIVCDNENRLFFTKSVPKAHVTYIGEDYARHLQSKVIEILDRIL